MNLPSPLVLASASPRRKNLLRQMGVPFVIHPSDVAEDIPAGEPPAQAVQRLAFAKASDVVARIDRGIVVGCDTIVVLDGNILGKPSSVADAERMLGLLSGRTHEVFTGIAVIDRESSKSLCSHERTAVTFRELGTQEIATYVASGSPLDKAGSYGIQDDHGAVFVSRIDGCYYNVVGLPLARLWGMLTVFSG
jgi:septum formation protein